MEPEPKAEVKPEAAKAPPPIFDEDDESEEAEEAEEELGDLGEQLRRLEAKLDAGLGQRVEAAREAGDERPKKAIREEIEFAGMIARLEAKVDPLKQTRESGASAATGPEEKAENTAGDHLEGSTGGIARRNRMPGPSPPSNVAEAGMVVSAQAPSSRPSFVQELRRQWRDDRPGVVVLAVFALLTGWWLGWMARVAWNSSLRLLVVLFPGMIAGYCFGRPVGRDKERDAQLSAAWRREHGEAFGRPSPWGDLLREWREDRVSVVIGAVLWLLGLQWLGWGALRNSGLRLLMVLVVGLMAGYHHGKAVGRTEERDAQLSK